MPNKIGGQIKHSNINMLIEIVAGSIPAASIKSLIYTDFSMDLFPLIIDALI